MGNKKQWNKPGLTILARSNPEESILSYCKGDVIAGSPYSDFQQCQWERARCGDWCAETGSS